MSKVTTNTELLHVLWAALQALSERRNPKRSRDFVKVKHEDLDNGLIRCSKCATGIRTDGGCNGQVCRRLYGGQGWFYFCVHCRREIIGGGCCSSKDCPYRNTKETRATALANRNAKAEANPIVLTDDGLLT